MIELLSLGLGALSYLFILLFVFYVLRVDYYNPIVKTLMTTMWLKREKHMMKMKKLTKKSI